MPCLGRFECDLSSFQVADFAHHHHVRILTQEGAQRRGKAQANLVVDVDLIDALQVDLDRVFGSGDV